MSDSLITWLHLLASMALVGGLIFSHLVLMPVVAQGSSDPAVQRVRRRAGRRFRTLAWVSLVVLIVTGAYRILQESGSARIETVWGVALMFKLLLFGIAFTLLLIHDFIIDPWGAGPEEAARPVPAYADMLQKAALAMMLAVLGAAVYLGEV